MNVTLYKAAEEFRALREQIDPETGEMPEGLGDMQDAARDVVQRKLLSCAGYIAEERASLGVLKEHIKRLQERAKNIERGIEWSEDYMSRNMLLTGILEVESETRDLKASLQKNRDKSVVVTSEEMVPLAYKRQIPASMEVDKRALLDALKAGQDVPGAALLIKNRLVIK